MAIRMEQNVFKMMVEMCYEAEACDVIQRTLDGLEEDFIDFKRVSRSSRIHFLSNTPYCGGKFKSENPVVDKNPTQVHTIVIKVPHIVQLDPSRDLYQPVNHQLVLGRTLFQKKHDIIVALLSCHNPVWRGVLEGIEVKTFNQLKPLLYEQLYDTYRTWYIFVKTSKNKIEGTDNWDFIRPFLQDHPNITATWRYTF